MHRQFSLQPFSRHYSHSTHPFLDFLDIEDLSPSDTSPSPTASSASSPPHITVRPSERAQLLEVLATYKAVQRAETLLTLTFVTVNDYLWLLRAVSQEMNIFGRNCLYYLAAAVSDFFLPRQKMVRAIVTDYRLGGHDFDRDVGSPYTRYSRGRAAYTSRWTKYPRS